MQPDSDGHRFECSICLEPCTEPVVTYAPSIRSHPACVAISSTGRVCTSGYRVRAIALSVRSVRLASRRPPSSHCTPVAPPPKPRRSLRVRLPHRHDRHRSLCHHRHRAPSPRTNTSTRLLSAPSPRSLASKWYALSHSLTFSITSPIRHLWDSMVRIHSQRVRRKCVVS